MSLQRECLPLSWAKEPLSLFETYGSIKVTETASGDRVVSLPSCSVPAAYLDRSTWGIKTGMGNHRIVYSVDTLTTGENPELVVKGAERIFTADPAKLTKGDIWWSGGQRSKEQGIKIADPAVELTTFWEAGYLLELWDKGIRAEVPQAVIVDPDDRASLVVNKIPERYGAPQSETHEELMQRVHNETDLSPVDATEYNAIRDKQGKFHLIDVNRWRWRPYTDQTMNDLLITIGEVTNNREAVSVYTRRR